MLVVKSDGSFCVDHVVFETDAGVNFLQHQLRWFKLENRFYHKQIFLQIGGALILGTALWTLITISGFQTILGTSAGIFASVYLMIGVGSLMLLISFFGCLGAFLESKYMLSFVSLLFQSFYFRLTIFCYHALL